VNQNQPSNPIDPAIRLSKIFWLIATVPLAWGLMKFTWFLILLFPALPEFLADELFLPQTLWPAGMLIAGAGLGILGYFILVPLRITTVRIMTQTVMFTLFMTMVCATTFAHLNAMPHLQFWLSKFLEIDPLVSISTALTTHTVYKGLIWSLIIIIPTLVLGRIFCGWICPFGTIHHFVGWLFSGRSEKENKEANRYHKCYSIKYYILLGMLACALFGYVQVGLLDPICLLYRSMTAVVLPTLNMPTQEVFGDYRMHAGGWFIGLLVLVLVAMNWVLPRFFCRILCPLGALLGILSRFALWRIERRPSTCSDCQSCLGHCEGACEPDQKLRMSECLVCFNCLEDCGPGAFSFAMLPNAEHEVRHPDLRRRDVIFSAISGVLFFSFSKSSGKSSINYSSKVIRPPGSVVEQEFLERCVKCDQCIRVCPSNGLQPAALESGLEGLWTPLMNFSVGYCQLNCAACGQVCPTGAIQHFSIEQKLGVGSYQQSGPIKLGLAHLDRGRCLPWSKNTPCVVCEEVCPTSPKAIHSEWQKLMIPEGRKTVVSATKNSVTLGELSLTELASNQACSWEPNEFHGDQATRYLLEIIHHPKGTSETHKITSNSIASLTIEDQFAALPQIGETAIIYQELKIPLIDTELCIGCGICENACPITGDRRGIYITAAGESRSQHLPQPSHNRSIQLPSTS